MGVDFGSKKAGTTVAVYTVEATQGLSWRSSRKTQDADAMLVNLCAELKPGLIALDAPLSIPGVYRELEGMRNYHYRHADHELMAMSPMFLGGLTARAIALAARLRHMGWTVIETYPARAFAQFSEDESLPKKVEAVELQQHCARISGEAQKLGIAAFTGSTEAQDFSWISNRHHFDAFLAWVSAQRFAERQAKGYGDENEGLIWI